MHRCVVSERESDIGPYLDDEGRSGTGSASQVAWPATLREASALVADCAADGTRLTVSGAGTGLCGGRIPRGGVVLATDRLPARLDLQPAGPGRRGATMRVAAGVALSDVDSAAAESGWLYPPDPTETSAFIGGTIATNAAGRRSYRFGATRAWIESLTVVLADGTPVEIERGRYVARRGALEIPFGDGRRRIEAPGWRQPATAKCAAGYWSAGPGGALDLVDLICGSEGTLAVVLEAVLRLVPEPRELTSGLFFFESDARALEFVATARGDAKVAPWSLELFDARAVGLAAEDDGALPRGQSAVFFEQPLAPGSADPVLERWQRLGDGSGAGPASILATDPSESRRLSTMRHAIPTALNRLLASRGLPKIASDAAVPRDATGEWLERSRADCVERGLDSVAFGHAGDGHVHVNVIPDSVSGVGEAREVCDRMAARAARMGGVVSAEHGLGKTKRHLLEIQYGRRIVDEMRGVKRALDPRETLGAGTLFEPAGE